MATDLARTQVVEQIPTTVGTSSTAAGLDAQTDPEHQCSYARPIPPYAPVEDEAALGCGLVTVELHKWGIERLFLTADDMGSDIAGPGIEPSGWDAGHRSN